MKFINHVKIAGVTGFFTGLLIGIVDILSKIFVWSFQWFEIYQALFTPIVIITPIFFVLGIITGTIAKILKFNEKAPYLFYSASSLSFLLFFYGMIIINIFLLTERSFTDPLSLILNFIVLLISIAPFVTAYFVRKKIKISSFRFLKSKKTKKIIGNLAYFVLVFIIISIVLDFYLLKQIPAYKYDKKIENYPNVILVVVDALRPDHLSAYGYPLETSPNLDKLAEESVVFENVITASPWTLPSISSILTGKYPYEHGATFTHEMLDNDQITLPEILKEKGYVTSMITGDVFTKAKYGLGQGFMTVKDRLDFFEYVHSYDKLSIKRVLHGFFPLIDKLIFHADDEKSAEEVNKEVFKWLEKNKDQKFFLSIFYYDPHDPYNLGKEFKKKFTDKEIKESTVQRALDKRRYEDVSEELVDYIKSLYDTEIYYFDYHLGKLVDKLDELKIRNNTLIIVTADHGAEFYEHGDFGNGRSLYQGVIKVPLIIYYPSEFKPARISEMVSLIDIFSTVLDVVNIPVPEDAASLSLVPLIKTHKNYYREYFLSEILGSWDKPNNIKSQRAIIKDDWKLIEIEPEQKTLPSSLFDLEKDPEEKDNFYDKYPKKKEQLKKLLENLK